MFIFPTTRHERAPMWYKVNIFAIIIAFLNAMAFPAYAELNKTSGVETYENGQARWAASDEDLLTEIIHKDGPWKGRVVKFCGSVGFAHVRTHCSRGHSPRYGLYVFIKTQELDSPALEGAGRRRTRNAKMGRLVLTTDVSYSQ